MTTVDIAEMHGQNMPYPDKNTQKFHSLDEYITMTVKLVRALAPKYRSGLATQILNSEDAISNIATMIMMADWRWNGNGTIHGYRKECAKWAILAFIRRDVSRSKSHIYSCSYVNNGAEEPTESFGLSKANIPVDSQPNPQEACLNKEQLEQTYNVVDEIIGSGILNEQQKYILHQYYWEGKTYNDIGKELGMSRQGVLQNIQSAFKKVKESDKWAYNEI